MKGKKFMFNQEMKDFIFENNKGTSALNLTKMFNEKFNTNISKTVIKNFRSRHKLKSGLTGRFPKGHVPYNKGKKTGYYPSNAFPKGNIPPNTRKVGSEQIRADGYLWIKIANPNIWKQKHRILWEEINGPIPKDHVLLFKNQDRSDIRIENLMLITKRQRAVMAKQGLFFQEPDLTESGATIAKLALKTSATIKKIQSKNTKD